MASATSSISLSEIRPQIQHIIEIPEQIEPVLPDECCNYKVPVHLQKLNVEAYTPLFISIGPFHSKNPELRQEKQKQRYFHAFWKRLSILQALALDLYKNYLKENREEMIKNCIHCKHFTDLIRYIYLPRKIQAMPMDWSPSKHFTECKGYKCVLKTATNLNEAGVSFEIVKGKSYLDIKFKTTPILSSLLCFGCLPFTKCFKTRLQIPPLKVHQSTECVLRNLIALEQCHYSDQPLICHYVSLIDSLIHTKEDVELLVDKEAIVHELGSHNELATMINGLCKHVVVTCNYYGNTIKKLNKHYNNCWMHYMGMLKSVYFRDPWRFSSTVVGVAVFLFAFFNFLRVIGVLHPNGFHYHV